MYMQKIEDNEEIQEENLPESTDEVEEITPVVEVKEPKEVEELGDEESEEILTKDDLMDEYEQCDNCGSYDLSLSDDVFTCLRCGCRWTYEE